MNLTPSGACLVLVGLNGPIIIVLGNGSHKNYIKMHKIVYQYNKIVYNHFYFHLRTKIIVAIFIQNICYFFHIFTIFGLQRSFLRFWPETTQKSIFFAEILNISFFHKWNQKKCAHRKFEIHPPLVHIPTKEHFENQFSHLRSKILPFRQLLTILPIFRGIFV